MFEIVKMTIDDIVEAGELLREAYEKDAKLCSEKANLLNIASSLRSFIENDNAFMFTYKEGGKIKGVCGFMLVPMIIDYSCCQAIEIACNPLYALEKIKKGKIFVRMIKKMEQVSKDLKANMFAVSIPNKFKNGHFWKKNGYIFKESLFVKEVI